MRRAALWPLLTLAALGCTDGGAVGRVRPKPPAAGGGGAGGGWTSAAQSTWRSGAAAAAGACAQPLCVTLHCNPADWWCAHCATDQDCADEDREKLCNPLTALCTECRSNDDCPASKPLCDDGDCAECAEDSDCPDDGSCNSGRCEAD